MDAAQQTDGDLALAEVAAAVRSVPGDVLDQVAAMLVGAGTVAAYGGGREGLVMQGLVMRLFHAGLDAHYVGEMTVPHLGAGRPDHQPGACDAPGVS